jgi:hypothetical protein
MRIFYWVAGVLLALTALPSAGFFACYIILGEDGCLVRAKAFYRWAVMVFLFSFNVVLYKYVILAFIALF